MTTSTQTATRTGTWEIDPTHSSLEFTVRHAMVSKVRGRFNDFTGTLRLDEDAPESSSAEVVVQLASVDTSNAPRAGLLTLGALLTNTSFSSRTSPVRRGEFVFSHLLCDTVPPPPPDVPTLPENATAGKAGTAGRRTPNQSSHMWPGASSPPPAHR